MNRQITLWLVTLATLLPAQVALAAPCTTAQLNSILAPAVPGLAHDAGEEALVQCDLNITPLFAAAITRALVFEGTAGSYRTLDCNGGTIDGGTINGFHTPEWVDTIRIRSRRVSSGSVVTYEPAVGVTIRNCVVRGSIRVMGMNSQGHDLRVSSLEPGHVERARASAPRDTTLEDVTIIATGRTPLYIAPGVSDTLVTLSHITGQSVGVALYLDAESTRTTVRDTTIDTTYNAFGVIPTPRPRELIAIDGSDYNRFINNWFSSLEDGGIYLYRNCGEAFNDVPTQGTIRITTPSHNEIINNVFYYSGYTGPNRAVDLGSRHGDVSADYCGEDDYDGTKPYGSSASDLDYATENVVMQNQIFHRSVTEMIGTNWLIPNSPNYISRNTTVTSSTLVSRPAGCYEPRLYRSDFLTHGTGANLFRDSAGAPYCSAIESNCVDGELSYAWTDDYCRLDQHTFGCEMSGNDAGCSGSFYCPIFGGLVVGAQAACNLESPDVSAAQASAVPPDVIRVLRASDVVSEGSCWIRNKTVQTGDLGIRGALSTASNGYGCRERDGNGGDCEIRGVYYCHYPIAPL